MKYKIASTPSKSIVCSDSLYNEVDTSGMAQKMRQFNSVGDFFAHNKTHMIHQNLSEYLQWLLLRTKLKRADVVVKTGLDKAYVYQIFEGKKRPSRDKLITIAFGMRLTEDETQRMLKLSAIGHYG